MEIQYFGANCLRITTRGATFVVDDNLAKLGLKSITKPTDVALHTNASMPQLPSHFTADMPGEYEVAEVSIHGVGARGAKDEPGQTSSTIFTIAAADLRVVIIGHIHPELSDDQVEAIDGVDIAIVPVGDGETLDGAGALQIIKKIEPKVVIPTHFADKALKYAAPQAELADALKGLSMEPAETVDKFKAKAGDLADTTRLIVLTRS